MASLFTVMLSRPVVGNAMRVAIVVGTCLNIINQGGTIWYDGYVDWSRFMINYAVPFLVASYSGAKARKSMCD
ncbi:MAG: hypothetical protein GW808_12530 [Sphingomonadales bacterium]|nr:hypothetical protein [Sphingomonadales bacterium]NCP00196.1 hypothetical protein [Sphingomonadales bacterium]NCP49913.1 hypothetical protein [Sphingomonadales bacterium]NCQ10004.1 hypothetical protein [Sphingomonadales bacterium]NCQ49790.1 hypothetical protein [Sphingomonadales bacterium]